MSTTTRHLRTATCVAVVTAGLVAAHPGGTASAVMPISGDGAPTIEGVDDLVEDFLTKAGYPGATVAITKGSRLVLSKGYGYADPEDGVEMQPHHRSKIGSTSKLITAIGAMQLVEAGDLVLDQPLYGSGAAPLWGSDDAATPGVVFVPDGALEDAGDHFAAGVAGVDESSEDYQEQITTMLDRMSDVRVRNVFSHTAGYRKSSDVKDDAADHFGVSVDELTTAQFHQAGLMGLGGAIFAKDPATDWHYSNFGYRTAQLLVDEVTGDYRTYVEQHLLGPLGLDDVVPNNADISELDAIPHLDSGDPGTLDPTTISRLGLGTGGWTASARDLARILCSVDQTSNHLRSLDPSTVVQMAADAEPAVAGLDPIGWDAVSGGDEMTKNGDLPDAGSSRVSKFLAGAFAATDDEINVAVAINQGDAVPSKALLEDLAERVAEADIPSSYDLFDPNYPCRIDPGFTTGDDPQPSGTVVVRNLRVDPAEVRTHTADGRPCDGRPPAEVSAHVGASSELKAVELTWRIGDGEPTDAVAMEHVGDGRFVGELGPFDPATVPTTARAVPVTVVLTATDDTGATATATAEVTLRRCELRLIAAS